MTEFLDSTVFVMITDEPYFLRAKRTIQDLRSIGQWKGDIVLIPLGFQLPTNFKDYYRIVEKTFPSIDKTPLLDKLEYQSFQDTIDSREIKKTNQWEKLHVFDDYFAEHWNRVVFLDAGMRVLDSVEYLLQLDYKDAFLAPDDGGNFIFPNPHKKFITQVSMTDPESLYNLMYDFGENILDSNYFLNCIWIYDTSILKICSKQEMIDAMPIYPICKTNEMTLMNLFLHFKYQLWKPFPVYTDCNRLSYFASVFTETNPNVFKNQKKILFDWSERNNPEKSTWRDYCLLKYPSTLLLDDT
jgi:hypothetical protein